MFYRQLRKGVNDNSYQLIPAEDSIWKYVKPNHFQDYYTSIYKYSEDQYQKFLETGSIKGVNDVLTDRLVFDFDSKDDISEAQKDAIEISNRLVSNGINETDLRISFSGGKGFHVEVYLDEDMTVDEFKAITKQLANGLKTFDKRINDHARPFRALGSVNVKTGLFKIPLTLDELSILTVQEIQEKAKSLNNVDKNSFKWSISSLPENLRVLKKFKNNFEVIVNTVETTEMDWTIKPKFLTNCRFSLQNGYFGQGDRNNALLCLAATYKNLGFDIEHTYRLLKGVAEKQSKRNDDERYPDTEIYNNIVMQVYSDDWKGGQFTCRDQSNWLYDYCESLGNKKCNHKEEDVLKPKKLTDIHESFKDYVVNIDKNTIVTGIKSLDEKIFLSTGANVGIIGSPGCHAKDAEILMYDGSIKKVQDVVLGDLLMGPDSQPREVLKLRRGREKMVKIKPLRGESFIVNMNHILHLSPSRLKTKKAFPGNLNIKVSDYIEGTLSKSKSVLSGYKLIKSGVEFSKKKLEIDPYILGLWLGDGSSSKPELTTMDTEIKNFWLDFAEKNNLKYKVYKAGGKSFTYNLSGKERGNNLFTKFLQKNNLINNKHIPKDYLLSDREDRLKLLAGLIDTDGYCEANKRGWEISSKFKNLADEIVFLARSLGFHAQINKRKKSRTSKGVKVWGDYYIVYISGQTCDEVPILLDRKKVKNKMLNNPLHQGFSYEILEEDDYYGFTLDKDHLYLTSDFFIHHNSGKTSLILDIAENTSKNGVRSVLASLDMHYNRLYEKALYRVSGLSRQELYKLFQTGEDKNLLQKVDDKFGNVNFFHKSCPTVNDLREYIMACNEQQEDKIKLVMLDYFERVVSDLSDDTAASKRVAGELQDLVNDLNICLITLVQPNKMSLSGGPDVPIMSYTSIKGSSYLYQSFRIIFSLWRPFYNPKDFSDDRYMQMAILKNDLGELAELDFGWNGKRGMITELEDHEKDELRDLLKAKSDKKEEKESW
jgi:hypothetical protein